MYPVLLAVAWVLNEGLLTEAEIPSMARPVLVAALVAVLLTLLGWVILRNRWDGGLVAGMVILLVILPFQLVKVSRALGSEVGFLILTMSLTAAIGIPLVLAVRARRQGRPIPRPSAGRLNEFGFLLLLAVVVTNTLGDAGTAVARLTATPTSADLPNAPSRPPDMVIILLDGYPRADVLERQLGIDNSRFLTALADRGFDVASDSHSNYVFTAATLASMFQMQYLNMEEVRREIGSPAQGHDLLRHAAVSGPAWSALKAAGYEIVTSPPGWDHVTLADVSDRVINDGHITEFERSLLEETWVLDVIDAIAPEAITGSMQARLTGAFDRLDDFATEDRSAPAFLFLHVPAPHPPLIVDADGELLPVGPRSLSGNSPAGMGLTRDEYVRRWQGVDQLPEPPRARRHRPSPGCESRHGDRCHVGSRVRPGDAID